jgi:hypothetical protein
MSGVRVVTRRPDYSVGGSAHVPAITRSDPVDETPDSLPTEPPKERKT